MISVSDLELIAGPRRLLDAASFHIGPDDRIGLVGRNGSGKTTLARVLAGELVPASGTVVRSGAIGYLPQDPGAGETDSSAHARVLSGRGLDRVVADMQSARIAMGDRSDGEVARALTRYSRLESDFESRGGYRAEAEAAAIAGGLALPAEVLGQPLATLSGGQRRRIELARVLFSGAGTLLLDEPTNHLDADSIAWLRDFLVAHRGSLVVISHDADLLGAVANRIFHLDADRSALDVYNLGWRAYLDQRESDERQRHKQRAHAERRAAALQAQADHMRAGSRARQAKSMQRRADQLLAGRPDLARAQKVAKIRFPDPSPCGRTPLSATGLSKSFGSTEVFCDVDVVVDRGARLVVLGLNGAGKTTLLRILVGLEVPDTGRVVAGHGLCLGYYAQEHETLDRAASVLENLRAAAPELSPGEMRKVLGSFLFSGDSVHQPAATLSGGERTRLALAMLVVSKANVLLLDEPTNNLDPASRDEVLGALATYRGAVVLVTHDEEAVHALRPERLLLLPDGVEDAWRPDLADLVSLA